MEVGSSPSGIDLAIATKWKPPPAGGGWGFDVLIECRDPTATGLQDFIPTLVEAAMTLPLEEAAPKVDGQGFGVLAGKPVIARLRFARSSADPTTRVTLGLESQGPNGVMTVKAPEGGPAARAFIAAGALATALVADKPPPDADATGVGLHALLVVALGLSTFLKDKGRLTLNAVELASTGHGLPVGDTIKLTLDYSVDVIVKPISVGALSVQMADEQPMRVRNRNRSGRWARSGTTRGRIRTCPSTPRPSSTSSSRTRRRRSKERASPSHRLPAAVRRDQCNRQRPGEGPRPGDDPLVGRLVRLARLLDGRASPTRC